MNVDELRRAILNSLAWAQSRSRPPEQHADPLPYQPEFERMNSDRDRLCAFVAVLSGYVKEEDPQLSDALMTFLSTKPGEALPAPADSRDQSA